MSEDKTDIWYFTAEEDDDFISGWYRVVDGRRIGDPLDTPPLAPALFSPAASAPVSTSFSGIFRQGIYADPSLGFNPFAQFDDIKVQVSQEISILEANSATNAIDSLDDFLMYVMSGTPEDVSDD